MSNMGLSLFYLVSIPSMWEVVIKRLYRLSAGTVVTENMSEIFYSHNE
jgi:hypothetical protein